MVFEVKGPWPFEPQSTVNMGLVIKTTNQELNHWLKSLWPIITMSRLGRVLW